MILPKPSSNPVSLANTLTSTLVLTSVSSVSSVATGIWFVTPSSNTVILTVAASESPSVSVTVYSKLDTPEYPFAGVNVTKLPATTAVPSDTFGAVVILKTIPPSSSPVSFVNTSTVTAVSYSVARESSLATGILFAISFTVIETVAISLSPWISETIYSKLSLPTNQLAGVYVIVRFAFIVNVPLAGLL